MDKALRSLEAALRIAQSTGNQTLIGQVTKQIELCWQRQPANPHEN
jgi:hypothetical protein